MENLSSEFLSNCCTVDMGALGWTTELEVMPSNLKPTLSTQAQAGAAPDQDSG